MDNTRAKRARSISSTSSSDSVDSAADSDRGASLSPPPKYHCRGENNGSTSLEFICTLPPTCSQPSTSTSYATQEELDRHQEAFHKWICHTPVRDRERERERPREQPQGQQGGSAPPRDEGTRLPEGFVGGAGFGKKAWRECGKAFPDERLLHLRANDNIEERRSCVPKSSFRLWKFECFLPRLECAKVFLTPAARRKHLIAKHKYPHGYFFAITNHGLNQIAQEDGFAISLIRPRKQGPPNRPSLGTEPVVDTQIDSSARPTAENATEVDMAVDELTKNLASLESSLEFLPRGVRKKKTEEEKGKMVIT